MKDLSPVVSIRLWGITSFMHLSRYRVASIHEHLSHRKKGGGLARIGSCIRAQVVKL